MSRIDKVSTYLLGGSAYSTLWAASYFVNTGFKIFSRKNFGNNISKCTIWHFFFTNSEVHLFPFFSPFDLLPIILLKVRGKKVVFGVHDFYMHKGERNIIIQNLIYLQFILADDIIVYSQGVLKDIKSSSCYRIFPKRIIESSLAISSFKDTVDSRNQNGLEIKSKLKLLFFGRIERYKGLGNLVRAFRLISTSEITLTICGRGKIDPKTLSIINDSENIILYNGWVEDSFLEDIIADSDLVCLPYNGATQSGVLFKAFEFGKPCLITPDPYLLSQADFGIWVTDGFDDEAIARQIRFIVENKDEISAKKQELLVAKKRFSPEVISYGLFQQLSS